MMYRQTIVSVTQNGPTTQNKLPFILRPWRPERTINRVKSVTTTTLKVMIQ